MDTITAPGLVQSHWSSNTTLDGLFLHLPGRVVVRLDAAANTSVAVTITSDSAAILALVSTEVDARSLDSFIEIDGTDLPVAGAHKVLNVTTAAPDVITRGALLVEVVLNASVPFISTHAETVLLPGAWATTVPTAQLRLRAKDSAAVFYADEAGIAVTSLKVEASDAASVQLVTPSLTVGSKLSLEADDSGRVAVTANTTSAATLVSSASDSGTVYLAASAGLHADKLSTSADDDGVVSLYPRGTCGTSKVDADDDGAVYIGSVVCVDTYASAADDGAIVLQTTGVLHATTDDGGSVLYFNSTPAQLPRTRRPHRWFRADQPDVHWTDVNEYPTYKLEPTPALEPKAVAFYPKSRFWSWSWSGGWTALDAAPAPVTSSVEWGAAVACLALVLLAAIVVIKRAARHRYQRIQ
ncbi:hypothetical protein ACHHYP_00255 [Achlya hypogyna]|uniref:Uncharacterized protein n=1 Tax=Achlya hypogyna TaxID=1202772 RepID=A0A1V9ZUQ5_ACHHY|nr:hypothetical protein ACHHYP_00255 [Achlya hypogyna]